MYYIGLDVHKKTISYCAKDASGRVCQEGKVGATRWELDIWIKTLPQPWTVAMEATIFTGWIYDHLKPHAAAVKVAHPLMLRAIAAAKKKNDSIDAAKIADCLRCDSSQSATWPPPRFVSGAERCGIGTCWYGRWSR
jgi:transposase